MLTLASPDLCLFTCGLLSTCPKPLQLKPPSQTSYAMFCLNNANKVGQVKPCLGIATFLKSFDKKCINVINTAITKSRGGSKKDLSFIHFQKTDPTINKHKINQQFRKYKLSFVKRKAVSNFSSQNMASFSITEMCWPLVKPAPTFLLSNTQCDSP